MTGAGDSFPVPAVGFGGAILAAFVLAGWGTPPHTELRSSKPAPDARLAESPGFILLVFTTEVQLALSSVEVRSEGAPEPSVAVG
ncbi:MAG: copper resistance protein CopC [Gemmatimonadetes bacterium]|nr:copper resistance protein CopC [Gemmatimonadota bacterium]